MTQALAQARKALEAIDGEAPVKEPRDGWTSTDLDETFHEGWVRGCWEMAALARSALAAIDAALEGGAVPKVDSNSATDGVD